MKSIKIALITTILLPFLVGCGSYHKLLKSSDTEKKYTEAIRYFYNKEYPKSLTLFRDVANNYTGSLKEDTILFYMGKALYNHGMYDEASEMMNSFRYKFTRSAFTEESEYVYAMCFYNQSGSAERDQTASFKAIQSFNEYLNRYPESIKSDDIYEMIEELSRKIYQKRYNNAALYYKLGKYNAAITALRSCLKQYPEIPFKEDMLYLICLSWYDYAENSVPGRQLDRYLKMMDAYYNYKSEYPDETKRLKELDAMFQKAKAFSDENGYNARIMAKDRVDIEQRKNTIAEKKDKLFFTGTKEERNKIKDEIAYEKEQLKKDRQTVREDKKEQKFQKEQLKNQKKQEQTKTSQE